MKKTRSKKSRDTVPLRIRGGGAHLYAAHRTMPPSQEDQHAIHAVQEKGPVHQSASVLLNRVK